MGGWYVRQERLMILWVSDEEASSADEAEAIATETDWSDWDEAEPRTVEIQRVDDDES